MSDNIFTGCMPALMTRARPSVNPTLMRWWPRVAS